MQTKVSPILSRVQVLLDDTQPKISEMVADASHVVYLARGQAQKMDRVLTEASDRLRGQLMHADRILAGALEAVEETGAKLQQGFWKPVRKASAVMTGIRVGLDLLRSRRASRRPERARRRIVYLAGIFINSNCDKGEHSFCPFYLLRRHWRQRIQPPPSTRSPS